MQALLHRDRITKIVQNKYNSDNVKIFDYHIDSSPPDLFSTMAQMHKIEIKATVNGKMAKLLLIAKTPAKNIQSRMAIEQKAFSKETFVYSEFYTKCNQIEDYEFSCVPECYFTFQKELLVLDNLCIKGYRNSPLTIPFLDYKHLIVALRGIAKFHVATIILERNESSKLGRKFNLSELNSDAIFEPVYRDDENYLGNKWFENSLRAFEDLFEFAEGVSDDVQELKMRLRKTGKEVFEIMKPGPQFRNVLCHGDMWSPNILFLYENDSPIDCKFVDFQTIRYNPPAHDVLNFIYGATSLQFRNEHKSQLIDYYYASLKCELERNNIDIEEEIPQEQFMKSCQYILPQVLIQNTSYATVDLVLYEPDILKNAELFEKLIYEDRKVFVREGYGKHETYKRHINECLQELCAFLMKK